MSKIQEIRNLIAAVLSKVDNEDNIENIRAHLSELRQVVTEKKGRPPRAKKVVEKTKVDLFKACVEDDEVAIVQLPTHRDESKMMGAEDKMMKTFLKAEEKQAKEEKRARIEEEKVKRAQKAEEKAAAELKKAEDKLNAINSRMLKDAEKKAKMEEKAQKVTKRMEKATKAKGNSKSSSKTSSKQNSGTTTPAVVQEHLTQADLEELFAESPLPQQIVVTDVVLQIVEEVSPDVVPDVVEEVALQIVEVVVPEATLQIVETAQPVAAHQPEKKVKSVEKKEKKVKSAEKEEKKVKSADKKVKSADKKVKSPAERPALSLQIPEITEDDIMTKWVPRPDYEVHEEDDVTYLFDTKKKVDYILYADKVFTQDGAELLGSWRKNKLNFYNEGIEVEGATVQIDIKEANIASGKPINGNYAIGRYCDIVDEDADIIGKFNPILNILTFTADDEDDASIDSNISDDISELSVDGEEEEEEYETSP